MNEANTSDLDKRIQQVASTYAFRFAGQPRHTRDPELLDQMILELDTVLAAARIQPENEVKDLLEKASSMRSLYEQEAQSIRELQAGDPVEVLVHDYTSWLQLLHDRYQRNFAGQSRSTRDLALLVECIEDIEQLTGRVSSLAAREPRSSITELLATLERRMDLYKSERTAIAGVRQSGTLEEQAGRLANSANAQFALYRGHFAGRSRLSRRPKLIERIVASLAQIKDQMSALIAQGYHSEMNDKNLAVVNRNHDMYRGEVTAIKEARKDSSFDDLVNAFGGGANELIEQYRKEFAGQDRRSRELADLNVICEGLYNLAQQMDELDRVREHEGNQRNLDVVLDHLRLYQREYALIRSAQSGS